MTAVPIKTSSVAEVWYNRGGQMSTKNEGKLGKNNLRDKYTLMAHYKYKVLYKN